MIVFASTRDYLIGLGILVFVAILLAIAIDRAREAWRIRKILNRPRRAVPDIEPHIEPEDRFAEQRRSNVTPLTHRIDQPPKGAA